ncbi:MAG: hypothetical protein ACM3SS_02690 [Rhodospirillaceae bacterium]
MARARNLKPGLFKNEVLGTRDPLLSLLFEGLWCLADKEGRLEDRPLRIKAEIFPYRDGLDVNRLLTELSRLEFIRRYAAGAKRYIQVIEFRKHQAPHHTEKPSEIPALNESQGHVSYDDLHAHEGITDESRLDTRETPSDSLVLIPDSLTPDSLIPDSLPSSAGASPAPARKREPAKTTETWNAYGAAYQQRHGSEPVRNATTNSQMAQFVGRIGVDEAPHVAAFYVRHNNAFYVKKLHPVGMLLQDAEKLRTEWATNRTVTDTEARQADRTQANGNVWTKLAAEARDGRL